ncbi:MAG TPA: hypothetical protein V6D11_26205 [Waterburya sp.]
MTFTLRIYHTGEAIQKITPRSRQRFSSDVSGLSTIQRLNRVGFLRLWGATVEPPTIHETPLTEFT